MNGYVIPHKAQLLELFNRLQRRNRPANKVVELRGAVGVNANMAAKYSVSGKLCERKSEIITVPRYRCAAEIECQLLLIGNQLDHIGVVQIFCAGNSLK